LGVFGFLGFWVFGANEFTDFLLKKDTKKASRGGYFF
jgi:hypothetical protein